MGRHKIITILLRTKNFKIYYIIYKNIIFSLSFFLIVTFLSFSLIYFSSTNYFNENSLFYSYGKWLFNFLTDFDLGRTNEGNEVIERLLYTLQNTLILTFSSLIVGFLISFTMGWVWSKYNENAYVDFILKIITIFSSTPLFLAAFIAAFIVKIVLIDPTSPSTSIAQIILYYSLPIIILSFFDGFIAEMTNYIKIRIDAIFDQNFMVGLSIRGGNIIKHFTKHIFFDILTILSSKFISLIGGAIIIEIIFTWEGIGLQGYNAVLHRDHSLFMGVFVIMTIVVIIINFILNIIKSLLKNKYQFISL